MVVEPTKLLIVDDEEVNLRLFRELLEEVGYGIETARNGEEALEKVEKDQQIKLVILDVMLPDIDGFEVCRRLRTEHKSRDIGVIIVTALDSPREKARGIESGADDYLAKPVYSPELTARVRNLMEVKESRNRLEKAYSGVHTILSYSEQLLGQFDPMWFDFAQAQRELIEEVFFKTAAGNHPQAIYVIHASGTSGQGKGLLYRRNGDKEYLEEERLEISHEDLQVLQEHNGSFQFYNNTKGEEEPSLSPLFFRSVPVQNYGFYSLGEISIVGVNFPGGAERMQGQVLKGVLLQLLLFRTIFLQTYEVRDAFIYTAGALARAAEAIDGETGNHIFRVGEYSRELARIMGMDARVLEEISYSAKMHDVGKMKISPDILRKPGPLTKNEFMEVENHTVYGVMILGDSPYLEMARTIALSHHEKWDGSGYPYGLKGSEIPLIAQIASVADIYDALRSLRSYKEAFSHDVSCRILLEGDGRVEPKHFKPEVLEAFRRGEEEFAKIFERLP